MTDRRALGRGIAQWLGKALVLALVTTLGSVVLWRIMPAQPGSAAGDGPLSGLQALLIVNLAVSAALSLLAAHARQGGWRLAALIFVALFGLQTFMTLLDGIWFNNTLQMSTAQYMDNALRAAIIAVAAGLTAMLLFRPDMDAELRLPKRYVWRIAVLTFVYVVLYFTAGMWAWQHPALPVYYAHMNVSFGPLVGFQVFRGLLWALIALFLVTAMRGSLMSRAAVMALLFAVLTAAQLLYPNPIMPWSVRQVHLVEVGVSEMIYGILATIILLAGRRAAPAAQVG